MMRFREPGPLHWITISRGPRTNAQGHRRALLDLGARANPAEQLAHLLGEIGPTVEAWWSPHTWRLDRRDSSAWQATSAFVVDVDYHGPDGKHALVPREAHVRLERAVNCCHLPGNIFHCTPRGARIVFVPPQPVVDRDVFARAIDAACVEVRKALISLDLHARQIPRDGVRDGYVVDEAATDIARFLFAPRAIVNGLKREAEVLVMRTNLLMTEELIALAPPPPTPTPRRSSVRDLHLSLDVDEAVRRWNEDHAADWGPPGRGDCPACGHRNCFGRLPGIPEKWCCFSGNHESDSGGCGYLTSTRHWIGDALDLEAYGRKSPRGEVLRNDGYLR